MKQRQTITIGIILGIFLTLFATGCVAPKGTGDSDIQFNDPPPAETQDAPVNVPGMNSTGPTNRNAFSISETFDPDGNVMSRTVTAYGVKRVRDRNVMKSPALLAVQKARIPGYERANFMGTTSKASLEIEQDPDEAAIKPIASFMSDGLLAFASGGSVPVLTELIRKRAGDVKPKDIDEAITAVEAAPAAPFGATAELRDIRDALPK